MTRRSVIDEPLVPPREDAPATLVALLRRRAAADPERPAFRDGPGRQAWSETPPVGLSAAAAEAAVDRLAARFAALRLPAGAALAIVLPGGTEACLAIMAAQAAGLVPCLLPVGSDDRDLDRRLEAVGAVAALTQSRIGELRPLDALCRIAAGRFRIRSVLAFGPAIADGVVDLGAVLAGRVAGADRSVALPVGEVVTMAGAGRSARALSRPTRALVAASVPVIRSAGIRAGDTVFSTLAADDLAGLCTGLLACLLTGATLESDGLPSLDRLRAGPSAPRTHLVLPGWTASFVAASGLPGRSASVILVHDPADGWPAPAWIPGGTVVDVLSIGETALLAASRDATGCPAIGPDTAAAIAGADGLLGLRCEAARGYEVRGIAAVACPFSGAAPIIPRLDAWRPLEALLPDGFASGVETRLKQA